MELGTMILLGVLAAAFLFKGGKNVFDNGKDGKGTKGGGTPGAGE